MQLGAAGKGGPLVEGPQVGMATFPVPCSLCGQKRTKGGGRQEEAL